jgi:DNA-binding transcriptional ArsR family regulator
MNHDSLTSRVYLDNIDPELLGFLKKYVNSFVKWDLLHFFYNNPHTIDTVENIARYAGRDQETVQRELSDLARRGLLEETQMGEMTIYALVDDPDLRERLAKFVEASEDREFRVRAIYHVIRDMRRG